MRIVTINIPKYYLEAFEELTKMGLYNSRSAIVRDALKDFLDKELKFIEDLEPEKFAKIKSMQTQNLA
ncbi:MAG: ribbon-helix-helix protein, CopG family [Candidatus Lokiarchaeota archaeon]|nr:ribbon-helix-helix protein, CopG family [Candidatus Lokiarchaeota archaeon]